MKKFTISVLKYNDGQRYSNDAIYRRTEQIEIEGDEDVIRQKICAKLAEMIYLTKGELHDVHISFIDPNNPNLGWAADGWPN
jgi:hypothetical protein